MNDPICQYCCSDDYKEYKISWLQGIQCLHLLFSHSVFYALLVLLEMIVYLDLMRWGTFCNFKMPCMSSSAEVLTFVYCTMLVFCELSAEFSGFFVWLKKNEGLNQDI